MVNTNVETVNQGIIFSGQNEADHLEIPPKNPLINENDWIAVMMKEISALRYI